MRSSAPSAPFDISLEKDVLSRGVTVTSTLPTHGLQGKTADVVTHI
jgi:hypothetical protein